MKKLLILCSLIFIVGCASVIESIPGFSHTVVLMKNRGKEEIIANLMHIGLIPDSEIYKAIEGGSISDFITGTKQVGGAKATYFNTKDISKSRKIIFMRPNEITIAQLVEKLGCCERTTIYNAIDDGRIKPHRIIKAGKSKKYVFYSNHVHPNEPFL